MTPEKWDAMTDEEKADDLQRALARMLDEIRDETAASRFRDRFSRERVHPVTRDINQLINFTIRRRLRHAPAVLDANRRVLRRVDTKALRFLVSVVLHGGAYDLTMRRRCDRILGYCDVLEAALLLLPAKH